MRIDLFRRWFNTHTCRRIQAGNDLYIVDTNIVSIIESFL